MRKYRGHAQGMKEEASKPTSPTDSQFLFYLKSKSKSNLRIHNILVIADRGSDTFRAAFGFGALWREGLRMGMSDHDALTLLHVPAR